MKMAATTANTSTTVPPTATPAVCVVVKSGKLDAASVSTVELGKVIYVLEAFSNSGVAFGCKASIEVGTLDSVGRVLTRVVVVAVAVGSKMDSFVVEEDWSLSTEVKIGVGKTVVWETGPSRDVLGKTVLMSDTLPSPVRSIGITGSDWMEVGLLLKLGPPTSTVFVTTHVLVTT